MIKKITDQLGIEKDCSGLDKLPDLELSMGSGEFTERFSLPPSAYVMQVEEVVDRTSLLDWMLGRPRRLVKQRVCLPAFMPLDKEDPKLGPVFILGMNFLRECLSENFSSSCSEGFYVILGGEWFVLTRTGREGEEAGGGETDSTGRWLGTIAREKCSSIL